MNINDYDGKKVAEVLTKYLAPFLKENTLVFVTPTPLQANRENFNSLKIGFGYTLYNETNGIDNSSNEMFMTFQEFNILESKF